MSNQRFYLPSLEETENFQENLLSQATKKKTESDVKTVQMFMTANAERLSGIGEEPDYWAKPLNELSEQELVNVMKSFAIGARTEKGEPYEPVSLQSFWYSVKRHLRSSGMDFNLPIFKQVTDQLKCAFKKLRAEGGGQGPNTSNGLTALEVSFLFTAKCAGAHHPRALINALVIYVMMMGRRGQGELHKLKYGELFLANSNGQIFLNLRDVQAKNRQGENPQDQLHKNGPLCAIQDKYKCPVHLFNIYSSKRPPSMQSPDSPLFLSCNTKAGKDYRREFNGEPWYISTRMGQNTLSKIVKEMVTDSGLSTNGRKITNTSVRKNTTCTLSEGGMSSKDVMAYTRHKSAASLIHYDSMNPAKATKATNLLLLSNESYDMPAPPPILTSSPIPTLHVSPSASPSTKKRSSSDLPATSSSSKKTKISNSPGPSKNKHPSKRSNADCSTGFIGMGSTIHEPRIQRDSKRVRHTPVRIEDPALLARLHQAAESRAVQPLSPSRPPTKSSAVNASPVSNTAPTPSQLQSRNTTPPPPPASPHLTAPDQDTSTNLPLNSPPVLAASSPTHVTSQDQQSPTVAPVSPVAASPNRPPVPVGFVSPLPSQRRTAPITPVLTPPQLTAPQASQVLNIFPDTENGHMTFNAPVTVTYNGPVTINKYYNHKN